MGEENLRRLVGLPEDEREAMTRATGRRIVAVEHEMGTAEDGAGESLLIVFDGGDALAVETTAELALTHLSPLARQVVQLQWSNPAPADGSPLYTVERYGGTHEVTREELRGWRRLKGPWYRLRGWGGL